MKKYQIILVALLIPFLAFGQVEDDSDDDGFKTIFGGGKLKVSGFGGPMMNFTSVGDDFAHMMGGGGGVIVGNFFFGGYGMGKTNQIPYKTPSGGTSNTNVDFGHGGLWAGVTMMPNKAIHPVVHCGYGWGTISESFETGDFDDFNQDNVYVISPTVEVEFNFSRFFKLGVGGTYTIVYGVDASSPYTNGDFTKPGVFASFKFGWF